MATTPTTMSVLQPIIHFMTVFSGIVLERNNKTNEIVKSRNSKRKVIEEGKHQYVHRRKYHEDRVISLSEYFPNRARGLQSRGEGNILNEKNHAGKAFSSLPDATHTGRCEVWSGDINIPDLCASHFSRVCFRLVT